MMRLTTPLLRAALTAMVLLYGAASHAEPPAPGNITPAELSRRLKDPAPPVILDVRTREEYAAGHIEGALNLPHDELEHRTNEIPGKKADEVIVYCRSGKRARVAEGILIDKGYTNVRDLTGHWLEWSSKAQ